MPAFFGDNNTPRRSDTQWIILQKILGALVGSGGSGGITAQQVYQGRDPLPPDNPSIPAISYDVTGAITQWNGSAWV